MIRTAFVVFVSLFVLSGCYHARKAQVETTVLPLQRQLALEDSLLSSIKLNATKKIEAADIDSAIFNRILEKLHVYEQRNDSLRKELTLLLSLLDSRQSLRKNYRKIIQPQSVVLLAEAKDSASFEQRNQVYLMLNDALVTAKQNLFYLAAFFGPGEFAIPEDKLGFVDSMFSPLLDSLIVFSNKYHQIERVGTLSFYGYADGQSIAVESGLADTLRLRTGTEGGSSAALNLALSHLRSEAMSAAIHQVLEKRQNAFLNPATLHLVDIIKGMGETYPNPRITDYQVDDERRRIVLFYWSVLPK
jgi:hypothetical protein